MTNTPGWASPGSSDSQEPDGGDSPQDTPSNASTAPADEDGATDSGHSAPAAQDDAPPVPPVSGVWSQRQPPPGPWQHTPSGVGPQAAARPSEPSDAPAPAPEGDDAPTPPAPAPSDDRSPSAGTVPTEAPAPTPPATGHSGGWGQQWAPCGTPRVAAARRPALGSDGGRLRGRTAAVRHQAGRAAARRDPAASAGRGRDPPGRRVHPSAALAGRDAAGLRRRPADRERQRADQRPPH